MHWPAKGKKNSQNVGPAKMLFLCSFFFLQHGKRAAQKQIPLCVDPSFFFLQKYSLAAAKHWSRRADHDRERRPPPPHKIFKIGIGKYFSWSICGQEKEVQLFRRHTDCIPTPSRRSLNAGVTATKKQACQQGEGEKSKRKTT